jgi:hypothetical protein
MAENSAKPGPAGRRKYGLREPDVAALVYLQSNKLEAGHA